jgi:hypothetical protein
MDVAGVGEGVGVMLGVGDFVLLTCTFSVAVGNFLGVIEGLGFGVVFE